MLFNQQNTFVLNDKFINKYQLFEYIADQFLELDVIESKTLFLESMYEREKFSPTGFQEGFALPHGISTTVKTGDAVFIKLKHPIHWDALDGKPIDCVMALAIPENSCDEYLILLSKIARKLIDDEFRFQLSNLNDLEKIINILNEIK